MNSAPFAIDVQIGERLRLRRIECGFSMAALGKLVSLSDQQISKYERGQHRVYAGKLFELSGALSIPITYFFDHLEIPQGDSYSRELIELARIYKTIDDPATRKKLRDLARTIAPGGGP